MALRVIQSPRAKLPANLPAAKAMGIGYSSKKASYRCFCGKRVFCTGEQWKAGITSCSCNGTTVPYPAHDLKLVRFGLLVVTGWAGLLDGKDESQLWQCTCNCGTKLNISFLRLISGETTDCGCVLRKEQMDAIKREKRKEVIKVSKERDKDRLGTERMKIERILKAEPALRKKMAEKHEKALKTLGNVSFKGVMLCNLDAPDYKKGWITKIPKATARLISASPSSVHYQCYCGKEAHATRMEWEAGIDECRCHRGRKPRAYPQHDLIGLKIGILSVKAWEWTDNNNNDPGWRCACDCGKEKVVRHKILISGKARSCGCMKKPFMPPDITGESFMNLRAIQPVITENGWQWLLECTCGERKLRKAAGIKPWTFGKCVWCNDSGKAADVE